MSDTPNTPLAGLVDRCEALLVDKRRVDEDLANLYAEVRGQGFDVKVFKKLVAERAGDSAAKSEEEALLDLYRKAMAGGQS